MLVSNAVGAVCFAAAYAVSKTLSRAEAFSDNDGEEDGDWSDQDGSTTDDTDLDSSSSFRNTPALKQIDPDTLFRLRTHLSQTFPARMPAPPLRLPLQDEHLTHTLLHCAHMPAPPLRLPFQELQGDLPLYFDPHNRAWTWLEPFPLDNPEEEARLLKEASLRRAHWRTSTPPRPRALERVGVRNGNGNVEQGKVKVVWTREEGTTTFERGGGLTVELPEGEYFPLVDVQGLPFYGLGPPSADATYLTTDGWVPVPLPDADAVPPLTPSPSNNRKRKGVHFDDMPYIKLVERLEYKVPRIRADEDVRAALRRVRRALEELEDLLLGAGEEEEGNVQVEDPFAFTCAREGQERVNAREDQEHTHAHAHEHAHPNAREEHADLYTPTKPTAAAAPTTRAPLQLLTPSSLERPAPYRAQRASSAAHCAPSASHRVPSVSHRVPSASPRAWPASHRASSAPPELYSPTPAPPAVHTSTPTLSHLREDSPTPVARMMNGRHMDLDVVE